MRQLTFVIQLASAVYLLWLGLYMLTRTYLLGHANNSNIENRPAWFIAIACTVTSVYMLGVAMETVAQTADEFLLWQRLTWWSSTYGITFFLLCVIYLDRSHIKRPITRMESAFLILLLAITTLMAIGVTAGFFSQTENVQLSAPFDVFFTPPRMPQYLAFAFWTIGLLTATVILLLRRSWKVYRQSKSSENPAGMNRGDALALAMAGVMILAGALIGVFGSAGMRQLGMVGIAIGSGFIGIAITRYQAFLHHRRAVRDFARSLFSTSIILMTYVVIFYIALSLLGYTVQPIGIALICFLVVITRAPIGWEERLSDRVFLPAWVIGYRQRIMAIGEEPVISLEPEKAISEAEPSLSAAVHKAQRDQLYSTIHAEIEYIFQYNRFNDDARLAKSALQNLQLIDAYKRLTEEKSELQHVDFHDNAAALRNMLAGLIDDEINICTGDDGLNSDGVGLVLLREKYINQKTRVGVTRHLLETYGIALRGGAYSRNLKTARIYLSKALCTREIRLRTQNRL